MSSSEPPTAPHQRWRLDIAYDGTPFRGFADQPGLPTVAGALADQIARTLRLERPPEIVGAGRTDAGVHALAQVVHCDLPAPLFADDPDGADRLRRRLNGALAGSIAVIRAMRVGGEFHARHSATWRAYRYLVVEDPAPLSFLRAVAWGVRGPLDLEAMGRAAGAVVGEHDFRSFCKRPDGASAADPLRREVIAAGWSPAPDLWQLAVSSSSPWRFDIVANAFCHQMVRSLVGAMVAVGAGRLAVDAFVDRLDQVGRDGLPAPAPPAGLALIGVGYPQLAGGPSGSVALEVP